MFPLYLFSFIAIYSQVFLIITLIEEWDTIFSDNKNKKLKQYPKVVIAVPCWNEETTAEKTILSLLNLNYPKEKLEIWIVDDGSTDNTWNVLQKFNDKNKYPQIHLCQKENGGKHTAVNYALEHSTGEIFGCLDADSYVYPDTLQNMLFAFEDIEVMATTPMMVVRKPTNILQAMQSVEYNFGLLLKRIFASINAIHVTPGPFSLFRRSVFEQIGNYRHAHNTEDMELTFRMQKNHMKIVTSPNAYVETSTPNTVYKLYKQRLRWTQGFMQNSIDYKDMLLRPKYGNVALFTIPLGWVGITMVLYMAGYYIYFIIKKIFNIITYYQTVGFDFSLHSLNFVNIFNTLQDKFSIENILYMYDKLILRADTINLLAIPIFLSGIAFILIGHHLSLMDSRRFRYIIYFIFLWEFLIPWWFAKALYNTIFSRKNQWR